MYQPTWEDKQGGGIRKKERKKEKEHEIAAFFLTFVVNSANDEAILLEHPDLNECKSESIVSDQLLLRVRRKK